MPKQPKNPFAGLTPKQALFIHHYIHGLSATRAYEKAGYTGTEIQLATNSSHLLRNHKVIQAIGIVAKDRHIDQNLLLSRLADLATADISEFFEDDGSINQKTFRTKGYLIKKRKTKRYVAADGVGTIIEEDVELHDSLRALDLIGRHLGTFKEHIQIEAGNTFQDIIKALRDKVNEKPVKQLDSGTVVDVQAVPTDTPKA